MDEFDQTHREKIIQHLIARFEAQVQGTASARVTWGVVSDLPLSKTQQEDGYAVGIYDTSEKVKVDIGRDTRFLNVVVEFHLKLYEDDPQTSYLRQALGEVQRVMGSDIYCGGLTMNVTEMGSELDVTSSNDRRVAGVSVFEVKYRTPTNQPFT